MTDFARLAIEAVPAEQRFRETARKIERALTTAERSLTELIEEATKVRDNLVRAADLGATPMGFSALSKALTAAHMPGASGGLTSNAERAIANFVIAETALRIVADLAEWED